MKSLFRFVGVIAALLIFITGCSKDTDANSSMKGKMDGTDFDCGSTARANKPEPGSAGQDDPVIRITGDFSGYSIKLVIIDFASSIHTGSYVFQIDKSYSGTIITNNINADSYYAGPAGGFSPPHLYGSGKIIINSISKKRVSGSFDFITDINPATGLLKTVTNGEFDIKRD